MEKLTILSFILVALSIVITLFSTFYSKLKPLHYWRTVLTLQFIAGLCGVIAVIGMSMSSKHGGIMYYVVILLCIIVSFVMSFILNRKLTKKNDQ